MGCSSVFQEIEDGPHRLVFSGDEDVVAGRVELDDAGSRRSLAEDTGPLSDPGSDLLLPVPVPGLLQFIAGVQWDALMGNPVWHDGQHG